MRKLPYPKWSQVASLYFQRQKTFRADMLSSPISTCHLPQWPSVLHFVITKLFGLCRLVCMEDMAAMAQQALKQVICIMCFATVSLKAAQRIVQVCKVHAV